MEKLAVAGEPINLTDLDLLTSFFFSKESIPEEADKILNSFCKREDLFLYTQDVMFSNCSLFSKFFFMKGLEELISTNWLMWSEEVKSFHRMIILKILSQPFDPANQFLMLKCSSALSQILIYDLDKNWPTFFDDFFQASLQNPINLLQFLVDFIQTMMDESGKSVVSSRSLEILNILLNQHEKIMEFVFSLLQNTNDLVIINAALPILSILVTFIPSETVVQSPLFKKICSEYISNNDLVVNACTVLTEFIRTSTPFQYYIEHISKTFVLIVKSIHTICISDDGESNILSVPYKLLISFFGAFEKCLNAFRLIFDDDKFAPFLQQIFTWLFQITTNSNDESLLEQTYNIWKLSYNRLILNLLSVSTKSVITDFFAPLRRVIIASIPCPYYFSVYIDEFQNESKQIMNKTIYDGYYQTVRECLIFLANENSADTILAIKERISIVGQLNAEQIQQICFAIAATAGAFSSDIENKEITSFIQDFFAILSQANSDDKMKIACGVVYMCASYRILISRFFSLFKSIFLLFLKFIAEGNEELQSVSIFSLKLLSQRTINTIVCTQENEQSSLLEILLENITNLFNTLNEDNANELFKVLSLFIRHITNDTMKVNYMMQLLKVTNPLWERVTTPNFNPYNMEQLHYIYLVMSLHSSLQVSLSSTYISFFKDFLPQLMNIFIIISQSITNAPNADILNFMKCAKSSIIQPLLRVSRYYYRQDEIVNFIIPSTFYIILDDYINSNSEFKVNNSLKYFIVIYNRCANIGVFNEGENKINFIDSFDQIFRATAPILMSNFTDFEWLRFDFFSLLETVVEQFTHIIVKRSPDYIATFINMVKFGAQHPQQQICLECLHTIYEIFLKFPDEMNPEAFNLFLDSHALNIIEFLFHIMTDLTYKFTFSTISTIIKSILSIEALAPKAPQILEMLCNMFPTLDPHIIFDLLLKLMDYQSGDSRGALRDLILNVKVVMPNDPDIYKDVIEQMKTEISKPFKSLPGFILDEIKEEDNPPAELIDNFSNFSIRHQG